MAAEWLLNKATNRWGLNKKHRVGPVSEWIRQCAPKSLEDWEKCYFENLRAFLHSKGIDIPPRDYIRGLGEKLYVKITEIIQKEVDEITVEDCIKYLQSLVLDRTFEGYVTEIKTIYSMLQKALGMDIRPAPDEWDRTYNVDFYIQVGDQYIGLQIKPMTFKRWSEAHKWGDVLKASHEKFEKDFGGKVFISYSRKRNNRKEIVNLGVIDEIQAEIRRLRSWGEG